jgi:putative FmdB family regulatory protein
MPIYEYQCKACRKDFDHLAKSMSLADADVPCPTCGSKKTHRKMSVFAVAGAASGTTQSAAGHQHTGMCGCGKVPGSCGMN